MKTTNHPPSESFQTLDRRPNQSPTFYERSKGDPLEFAYPVSYDHSDLILEDQKGLQAAIDRGDSREIAEFAADLAYLGFLDETGDVQVYTQKASEAIKKQLEINNNGPAERLSLRARLIDMNTLQAFSAHQDSMATIDRGDGQGIANLDRGLEASLMTGIIDGVSILSDMQLELTSLESGTKEWEADARAVLVGKMFELLYATIRRLKIYSTEAYDQLIVLGATEFQDRPAVYFTPNHNFDLIEISDRRLVTRLFQCKAGESSQGYDGSITPVSGQSMGRFNEDPRPFIEAIGLIVGNNSQASEKAMHAAGETIDSLVKPHPQKTGRQLVRTLVHA